MHQKNLPPNHTYAASREDWRTWLLENHAGQDEVWLVYYKKDSGRPSIRHPEAVQEALCFGWIDGMRKSIDEQRFMQRFTPRRKRSNWSELNKRWATELIDSGQMTAAGLEKIQEAKDSGKWDQAADQVDTSKPHPEFKRALEKDTQARKNFAGLSPSQRRMYLGWINSAKRDTTRKKRIVETLELLQQGKPLGLK